MVEPAQGEGTGPRRFSVALLGGLRSGGRLRLGDRLTRVTLIGGIDLDLTETTFTGDRLTVTKISLIGGVHVRVPPTARVEIHGLSIGGRRIEGAPAHGECPGPLIAIHAYGVLGGVKVHYAEGPLA
jgi:hypothetical protein